jgi:hypothetical protein
MKFLTLADWTGMVETELFAATYKTYGLTTVRYPVLEIMATVEPFENGRGFSLRVLRASKPRMINGIRNLEVAPIANFQFQNQVVRVIFRPGYSLWLSPLACVG